MGLLVWSLQCGERCCHSLQQPLPRARHCQRSGLGHCVSQPANGSGADRCWSFLCTSRSNALKSFCLDTFLSAFHSSLLLMSCLNPWLQLAWWWNQLMLSLQRALSSAKHLSRLMSMYKSRIKFIRHSRDVIICFLPQCCHSTGFCCFSSGLFWPS